MCQNQPEGPGLVIHCRPPQQMMIQRHLLMYCITVTWIITHGSLLLVDVNPFSIYAQFPDTKPRVTQMSQSKNKRASLHVARNRGRSEVDQALYPTHVSPCIVSFAPWFASRSVQPPGTAKTTTRFGYFSIVHVPNFFKRQREGTNMFFFLSGLVRG
jgi:hypothetical protein